eukprot:Skav214724  [mRNA]  locus=scaffold2250:355388:364637:- [translate_table: standard]
MEPQHNSDPSAKGPKGLHASRVFCGDSSQGGKSRPSCGEDAVGGSEKSRSAQSGLAGSKSKGPLPAAGHQRSPWPLTEIMMGGVDCTLGLPMTPINGVPPASKVSPMT